MSDLLYHSVYACARFGSHHFLWVEIFMTAELTTKITNISTPQKLPAIRYRELVVEQIQRISYS